MVQNVGCLKENTYLCNRKSEMNALLAQLVEQLTLNQWVPGSKPCRRTNGPLVKWLRRRPLTPESGVRLSYGSPYAPLAQLVEHLTLNQGVQGSSP